MAGPCPRPCRVAAFAFVFTHGTSAFVMLRLRRERDPARSALMLDRLTIKPF